MGDDDDAALAAVPGQCIGELLPKLHRHSLVRPNQHPSAVIENEFGEVGIDDALVKQKWVGSRGAHVGARGGVRHSPRALTRGGQRYSAARLQV